MQHIQDKEFDQRLRDQFENSEIELPASSWSDLEHVLHLQKKRGALYRRRWLVAASVLLLSSLGAYMSYYASHQVISKERLALNTSTRQERSTVVENKEKVITERVDSNNPDLPVRGRISLAPTVEVGKVESEKNDIEAQPVIPMKEEIMLSSLQPSSDIARHVDNKTLYKPDKLAFLQASNEISLETDSGVEDADQQRGIRNVGDLVNYVVDKVDKRAEKILKFKTDDDNSSLIAINIGMLKLNQKKQK
ncbi:hypothetical protein [Pedobacter antarcticus]|uniref:hypothetical protein n=1 Tax=Pedobacter antarcticus TaxID=34086 RepID=UPI00088E7C35|nr:hypothetical protein [Pedobacter antarcticus]SDM79697.1 hypothetical protein SAMN04488084_11419 [Pedobacter antarcticus]